MFFQITAFYDGCQIKTEQAEHKFNRNLASSQSERHVKVCITLDIYNINPEFIPSIDPINNTILPIFCFSISLFIIKIA